MIADKISAPTIECFLNLRIKSGVKNPNLDKKYTNIGNSNTKPFAKHNVEIVVTKDDKLIWLTTKSLTW